MRRDFLAYLEKERAHPYRTFLHYNSWYDLGYFTPYTATDAVDRINAFGHELTDKRGVQLNSFLFDDGWDKHDSLWKFNSGFPDGFTPLKNAAQKYDADPGVWMSPWGGYSSAYPILRDDNITSFGPPPAVMPGQLADRSEALFAELGWSRPAPRP